MVLRHGRLIDLMRFQNLVVSVLVVSTKASGQELFIDLDTFNETANHSQTGSKHLSHTSITQNH